MKNKKILIALAALTAISATSCSKLEIPPVTEDPDNIENNEPVELLDISSEYSLEVSSEMIKAGENLEVYILSESDRKIFVAWESTDHKVLSCVDGVFTGVGKGFATVSAKISAEGCEEFELTYTVEVKPEDYTLALIDNFILITDLSTKVPEEGELLAQILSGGRQLISASAQEGYTMKKRTSSFEEQPFEILVGETSRKESIGAGSDLEKNEFSIKAVNTENGMKILINATDKYAMMTAFEVLIDNTIKTEEGTYVPSDLDIKMKPLISKEDYSGMFESENVWVVRDPCVIYDGEKYYMYGTGLASGLGYGCVTSDDLKTWSEPFNVYTFPEEIGAQGDCWAPECHYYKGNYYIFATYRGSNGLRGCAIFKSETPAGPFEMITDGHITSSEWNAIDASLYVDENGDPWIIYVREWVSAPNEIGTFEVARLSEDLTKIISEPIEIFKANSSAWATKGVTDGCWAYKMQSTGSLIMLWSNWDGGGYCIGMARSKSGSILGPWEQISTRLYSSLYSEGYDGGHGSIFTDKNGQMMVSFHGPNDATDTVREHAFFLPIEEDPEGDMLRPKQ
ncbi:MAG: hypothetical protein E7481_07585 [Ruminococcaceae bacterium]|nr:hypothetical protein [Oscillospiraceae bacterium]